MQQSSPRGPCACPLSSPPISPEVQCCPTWAALRTAILRTVAGALAPKEAGMDFWMFPNVSAPYLWDKALLRKLQLLSPTPGGGTMLEHVADSSQHPGALGVPRPLVPTPALWCRPSQPPLLPVQPEAV